jgi:hypothetical protein
MDPSANMFESIALGLIHLARSLRDPEVHRSLRFELEELVNAIELTLFFGSLAGYSPKSHPYRTLLRLHKAYSKVQHLLIQVCRLVHVYSSRSLSYHRSVFDFYW